MSSFLGFIGAGRMAQAMCRGIIKSGVVKAPRIMASDPDGRILTKWEEMRCGTTSCNKKLACQSEVIVVGVKPNMVRRVLRDISSQVTPDHLIVSIAAGITLKNMQKMFMALEAMADGGVKMGLPRPVATRLAAQTMMGSAKMVLETEEHPGSLQESVCSPSGTTIQGVYELEKSGFRYALASAVEAAAKRSFEFDITDKYDTVGEATGIAREHQLRMNALYNAADEPKMEKPQTELKGPAPNVKSPLVGLKESGQ